jgi:hypothetical protein
MLHRSLHRPVSGKERFQLRESCADGGYDVRAIRRAGDAADRNRPASGRKAQTSVRLLRLPW